MRTLKIPAEPLLLRVSDVMAYLHELVNSGQLPTIRIGRSIRVPMDALLKWVEAQQAA